MTGYIAALPVDWGKISTVKTLPLLGKDSLHNMLSA
jgi:hypothetical protein